MLGPSTAAAALTTEQIERFLKVLGGWPALPGTEFYLAQPIVGFGQFLRERGIAAGIRDEGAEILAACSGDHPACSQRPRRIANCCLEVEHKTVCQLPDLRKTELGLMRLIERNSQPCRYRKGYGNRRTDRQLVPLYEFSGAVPSVSGCARTASPPR